MKKINKEFEIIYSKQEHHDFITLYYRYVNCIPILDS